jgi:hypothetical protein
LENTESSLNQDILIPADIRLRGKNEGHNRCDTRRGKAYIQGVHFAVCRYNNEY